MPLIRAHIPHKTATVSTVSIGEIHKIIPNKIEIIPLIIKNILVEDENDLSNVNIPVTIIKTPHTLTKFTRVLKGLKKNKIPIIPNKIPSTIKNFSKKSFITHHILKK